MSKLGAKGRHIGNAWRDLKRKLRLTKFRSAVGMVSVRTKEFATGVHEADLPILYPHHFLATLYSEHPDRFTELVLGGSPDNIPAFWAEMHDHLRLHLILCTDTS